MFDNALLELDSVSKTFAVGGQDFAALSEVSLTIHRGEFVVVVGRSGSGKTTLLNLMAGIDHPTAGTVTVAGTDLASMSERTISPWRGRVIGVVFQFFQLLPTLSVVDNVMLPMDFCRTVPTRERRPRALELLDRVGIADQADKLPRALSGGQQQRAAIARALANEPPLILADEPTGNLDSVASDGVMELFAELARDGSTIVLVTHERDLSGIPARRLTMSDGQLSSDEPKAGA